MKHLLLAFLLIPTLAFGQATRDVQKKASRQTANVETLTDNKTLTYLDAETQLLTPSGANRTVTLPSASVWKAWSIKIANESTTLALTVNASGGTQVGTIAPAGYAEFIARTDTPTVNTGWSNLSQKVPTVPVGAIQAFGGASCPDGWLDANGVAQSSTTYVALDAYFGTTWGARSGGNFQIPNLNGEGRYLRGGSCSSPATCYQDDATAKNSLSVTNNAVNTGVESNGHYHNLNVYGGSGTTNAAENMTLSNSNSTASIYRDITPNTSLRSNAISQPSTTHTHSVTSNVTLGDGDTETRPITAVVKYCIKY